MWRIFGLMGSLRLQRLCARRTSLLPVLPRALHHFPPTTMTLSMPPKSTLLLGSYLRCFLLCVLSHILYYSLCSILFSPFSLSHSGWLHSRKHSEDIRNTALALPSCPPFSSHALSFPLPGLSNSFSYSPSPSSHLFESFSSRLITPSCEWRRTDWRQTSSGHLSRSLIPPPPTNLSHSSRLPCGAPTPSSEDQLSYVVFHPHSNSGLSSSPLPLSAKPPSPPLHVFSSSFIPSFFSGWIVGASAWSVHGHEAIGMTAMSGLKGVALTQVKRLMNGKDVVDVSAWAHKVNKKYPRTTVLHFQKQDDWQCERVSFSQCNSAIDDVNRMKDPQKFGHYGTQGCLIGAIRHLYGRLAGKPKLQVMEIPDRLKLSDADAVKYLINLIGDLHQPLHLGFWGDDCGKMVPGKFRVRGGQENHRTTLFDMWDSDLIDKVVTERQQSWYSGWTHVNSIKAVYEQEKQQFAKLHEHVFDDWAEENLKLACSSIYTHPNTKERIKADFVVDMSLEAVWFELIRHRILLAGARVAIVLNDILQSREASKLRVGTTVKNIADDETEATAATTPSWLRNLAINLSIVTFVGCLFVYITRYYSPATPRHTARKMKESDGFDGMRTDKQMVEKSS